MAAALLVADTVLLTTGDPFWTDFANEAWPVYEASRAGDLAGFRERLPGYATFTVLGAPLALLAEALGSADRATLRLLAAPGALGVALLAAWPALGRRGVSAATSAANPSWVMRLHGLASPTPSV